MPKNETRKSRQAVEVDGSVTIGSTVASTQSGTWTVQPGNTPNTSPWLTDNRRGQTILFAAIDHGSSGDNTIVAADATKKIKVLSYQIVATGAVDVAWKSGASTALTGAMALAAAGSVVQVYGGTPSAWILQTAVNEALVLNLSGAVAVDGHVAYFLEA
jgi:hypothetical protein